MATSEEHDRLGHWSSWRTVNDRQLGHRGRTIVGILLAVGSIAALYFRFWTNSLLWLDEVQSVNLASKPVSQIPGLLREDGAPPLYYVLLHFWMSAFGTSDHAVRSLSGVFSVVTVVLTYFIVKRVWGSEVGLTSAALLGSSSFAVYYATESRMYALVMFVVVLGIWRLARLYEAPTVANFVWFGICCAALVYTQYWALYLFAVLGVWFVAGATRSGDALVRRSSAMAIGSLGLAGVLFLPWFPSFLYQHAHTGTPWGSPPNFLTAVVAVFHFHANQAVQVPLSDLRQRAMEAVFIVLFILALFGTSQAQKKGWLTWRPQKKGTFLAWVVFGTLVLGVVVSHFANTAYAPRYGAVVYVPLIVFMAVGIQFFTNPVLRVSIVVILVAGFSIGSYQESHTQRSQAAQAVSAFEAHGSTGDVAVFCPDELGPTVVRILPSGKITSVGYPRFTYPSIVNWVNYNQVLNATSPTAFVHRAENVAGTHHLWLIWAPGYGASGPSCTNVAQAFNQLPGWSGHIWVRPDTNAYFQSMTVIEYTKN